MPTAQFFAPGFDEQVEQQNIERQRKMADLLRQQAFEPNQGQMVSGHYVAPSVTQHLAKLLQGYNAGKSQQEADEKQQALAEAIRARQSEEFGKFTDLLTGKPAQKVDAMPTYDDTGYRQEGFSRQQTEIPAVAPDMAAAYKYAAQARTPALQQFGVQGALTQAQEQAKLAQAEAQRQKQLQLWSQAGGNPQQFMALGGDPKLAKELAESPMWGKEELTSVNGQLVGKYSGNPVGKAIPKQADAVNYGKDWLIPDGNGGYMVNEKLVGARKQVAAAGKPQISVDARQYSTQENEQSKAYGKSLGEIRANINQAGWDAPKKLAQLSRMEQLLQGIDGGAAAPTIAQITSLANSFGIKLDPRLGAKQAAEALSREMAGSLRQPGTGPMTDKDFDNFLLQVPSLSKTAEGRAQITKTMRAAIERDQRAAKFARDYAQQNKGVIDDGFFDAMANFYAENPIVMPQMPERNVQGAPLQMPKGFRVVGKE